MNTRPGDYIRARERYRTNKRAIEPWPADPVTGESPTRYLPVRGRADIDTHTGIAKPAVDTSSPHLRHPVYIPAGHVGKVLMNTKAAGQQVLKVDFGAHGEHVIPSDHFDAFERHDPIERLVQKSVTLQKPESRKTFGQRVVSIMKLGAFGSKG